MVTLEQFRYHPTQAARSAACFDFHYSQPGMVAIFGDSGSGKSTLAQIMAGWYPDFLPGDRCSCSSYLSDYILCIS